MSTRFQVVVPDPVAMQLRDLAAGTREPPSTLAAQLLRSGVAEATRNGKVRPLRPALTVVAGHGGRRHARGERPGWFEPYGGDPQWRQQMWGAIVALYGRYPRQLEALNDGWWNDEAHTEILCALAVWREQIDEGAESPCEELSFHRHLAHYAATLRREGGGVASAWQPGAPPPEWLAL